MRNTFTDSWLFVQHLSDELFEVSPICGVAHKKTEIEGKDQTMPE